MPKPLNGNRANRPNGAMVTVTNAVDASKIRTETDEFGDTIIIVPSYTMPDNVVMNGGFYPTEEIEAAYMTLDGTPAPLSHPMTKTGDYISASSEIGVHNFQCGVFNGGVKRENGRIYVEKRINKRIAMQSDRGKRVLDRIEAFMKGDGDPIHTSTGIFLDVEELAAPVTNEAGEEYTWIARNMYFDHDAILLDEEGAATPEKGVGMMVNSALHTNLDNSESDKREAISMAIREEFADDDNYAWLVDYDDSSVIFEVKDGYYQIGYTYSENEEVSFVGQAQEVRRKTVWQAIANWFSSTFARTNSSGYTSNECGHGGRIISNLKKEDDMSFRQKIIDQLKANNVELDYDNVTDEQLLDAVNKSATTQAENEPTAKTDAEVIANAVAEAVKPLNDKIDALQTKVNAQDEAELNQLREQAVEALELEEADVKTMSANALKKLLANANSQAAYHVGGQSFAPNSQQQSCTSLELPNVEG